MFVNVKDPDLTTKNHERADPALHLLLRSLLRDGVPFVRNELRHLVQLGLLVAPAPFDLTDALDTWAIFLSLFLREIAGSRDRRCQVPCPLEKPRVLEKKQIIHRIGMIEQHGTWHRRS